MISLESKLAFLRQPGSYHECVYRVEAVETHMSWVFLTENHAYKLKKPVHYGLLDFSTVEARKHFCEEEVRLNRRLAPDIYLATIPLVVSDHHLDFGGPGTAVDWLVKMRRLPAKHMLDYMIRTGTARRSDMKLIATQMADFYRNCAPIEMKTAEYRDRIERDIEQSRLVLTEPSFRLPGESIVQLCSAQRAAMQRIGSLLDERICCRRIVEGHGDLRAEHVCMETTPIIIDCLEFSRELRIIDAADEMSFLALECERLGAPELGRALIDAYGSASGDAFSPALVHFYQSVRACLRARLTIRYLSEEKFQYSPEWHRRSLLYLQLAENHIAKVLP
ncbi:hypothetical protein GCM10027343_40590 [Noviherbaspirillum agri]